MKRFLIVLTTVFASAVGALFLVAARHEPVVRPNTYVGIVPVGGLSLDEAARRVRIWWEAERVQKLTLESPLLKKSPPPMTPGSLGVTVDDAASVADLPLDAFEEVALRTVKREDAPETRVPVRFKTISASVDTLKAFITANTANPSPAKVLLEGVTLRHVRESVGLTLDVEALPEAVLEAVEGDKRVRLPIVEAPKRVPDEELAKVTDVVHEFSTKFNARQYSRSSNIRLAASRFNGMVLMPGESLSFNGTVGRRTIAAGFKEAGVYLNGRHDTGIGGGICQVSTTLYNAALFANLKIVKRLNHSMPVPYVPVGRDATVDYGNIDLVIENSYDTPIAIVSRYEPGKLTFMVLGRKDPSLEVKVAPSGHRTWDRGVKTVPDPNLPAGKKVIVEKGSPGHSIVTHRMVYRNGQLVAKEPLGRSHYAGAVRIVAQGTGKAPAAPSQASTSEEEVDPFAEGI